MEHALCRSRIRKITNDFEDRAPAYRRFCEARLESDCGFCYRRVVTK